MGIQDFTAIFNNIDTSCKGYITTEQVMDLHEAIHFAPISLEQVTAAIQYVCGTPGHVYRSHFMDVLEELERRRSTEEQAYWDFKALDYNGTSRICLKDALLMFKEFHGDRFSLYTWNKFLASREVTDADVFFDEIRLWLCSYPEGEPATLEQITQEEEKLERTQHKYDMDGFNSYKYLQDDKTETQDYKDESQRNTRRRLNKWKKQGLESMLFDDGLDVDDVETLDASKDRVTMNDIVDALDTKYELLREKLLLEMARMSSAMEGDQSEIYQDLCKKERLLWRSSDFETQVFSLSGSKIPMKQTLLGMMGEVRPVDTRRKRHVEAQIKELELQGRFKEDIGKIVMSEYTQDMEGDCTFGAALIHLYSRCKEEKEAILSIVKEAGGHAGVITMENCRLSRQQMLIAEEGEFHSCAISVGLAERLQKYKSSRLTDWDRIRSERLAQFRLTAKKGRKQNKTPHDNADRESLEDRGVVDLQRELVTELVKKHMYEREAAIHMLQGRDSEVSKASAKAMTPGERTKQLKTLRNQHTNWKNSKSDDQEVLHKMLGEAVGLYYENRKLDLQQIQNKVFEDDINQSVLSDLQQRQEVEFDNKIQDILKKGKEELIEIVFTTNRHRIEEHYDNLAYVVLGTIEISEADEIYVKALEEKYEAIREKVFLMGLKDEMRGEWKKLTEKEKSKEIKERRKREKKLRGAANYHEMDDLVGPKSKAKMLPPLRKLIGEDRGEFEIRFMKQKKTGQVQDEASKGNSDPINILADLVPRYDDELDTLINWLQLPETKALPAKLQRVKILQLKLERCAAKMEEDFEVAALFVGLLERVLATLYVRHPSDNIRQRELAKRRVYLRNARLQQNEAYVKHMVTSPDPQPGDTTGWQMAYLRELLIRHDEEREHLLQFLQDDSMEDLQEAAAMMSDQDIKSRLAELHAKRRKLDLTRKEDQDENTTILEEAVALRAVCKQKELKAESRRDPNKDDVIISILKDLQEEQDREIANILENIVDLKEDELSRLKSEEKEDRDNGTMSNVFIVLTQSESKTHEQDIVKALHLKYETIQQRLLMECLIHKHGESAWSKMGDKEKQNHVIDICHQANTLRQEGNNVGLIEILGGFKLDKPLLSIIGVARYHFLMLASDSEEELLSEPAEEEQVMRNPLLNLWQRFDKEKKNILQKLKGLQDEYMSDMDQQIRMVRINRETLLCIRDDGFIFSAMLVGLAERQLIEGKPRLVGDRGRYEKLAKHKFSEKSKRNRNYKDQVIRDPNLITQMNAVLELLEFKHQFEQDQFKLLLEINVDQSLRQEVVMMSQQQKKDRLDSLRSQRKTTPLDKQREHDKIFTEGVIVKRELCRQRMSADQKAEATDVEVHQALMAELLLTQNCEAERLLQSFRDKDPDELQKEQLVQINERKVNSRENVAGVVFSLDLMLEGSTDSDLMEALEGKYDALRDKLLAEALIKQLGDSEWNRLSDLERQKKMMELKLKERQLRREGKFDELAQILGDALEDQETLKRLMGESREEQERKLKERLNRRKQRRAQGLSEEECDEMERQDIQAEEEEERKKRKNILLELEHRYDKEKEELLRQIGEGDDRLSKERARQLKLLKLKREERKARNEDKFDSAALVLGLAEENEKKRQETNEEERKRQERLARERIEAARRRRKERKTSQEEIINTNTDNKVELQESLNMAVDRRHRHERDLLIQLLDDASNSDMKSTAQEMSEEDRQNKLYELQELRKHWRSSDKRNPQEQVKILQEAACYLVESLLHKHQEAGETKSEEEVKVEILSDLQQWQDTEARMILSDLQDKDVGTLQQMIQMQSLVEEEGLHDNVSHVLLQSTQKGDGDDELVQALEQKYDALKDKLLEATLIQELGEDEWSKLSDAEKKQKIVDLKMKERKLRQEGKMEEAAAIFEKLLENDEVLDKILGGAEPEDKDEKEKRRLELIQQRQEQGLPVDEETINNILEEETKVKGRQRRKNVLENLDLMLEDEKARLLRALKKQHDHIAQERERQLNIARLQHERRKLQREEKFESAAMIVSMARENQEKHMQTILEGREKQKALAKERLEARRKKRQQKTEELSMEQKLKDEAENEQREDMPTSQDVAAVQTAIFEALDQRQTEERDILMDTMQTARNSVSIVREAKAMSTQDLKTQLLKLEKDEQNWKKSSMQIALSSDEGKMSPKERERMFKGVAERRNEHVAILSEAMVYKLELEEQVHKSQHPSVSTEEVMEELNVMLLADLQEKQTTESNAVQELLQAMDEKQLKEVKRVQRLAKREGWYDSLTGMLFQLSGTDLAGEEGGLEVLDQMKHDMDLEMEKERENLINEARESNITEEELQEALKQLEKQQQHRRKAVNDNLEQQRRKILQKVSERKREAIEKETEEIRAAQLVLLGESQKKMIQENIEKDKTYQNSELQKRLEARRQARQKTKEEPKEVKRSLTDEERFSGDGSRPSSTDSSPFAAMRREKTALDVTVSDKEKQDTYTKLVQEQKAVIAHKMESQRKQEEMLKRRLAERKNKQQAEAHSVMSLGERQKTEFLKSKQDEKQRQLDAVREKVKRERSRSPGMKKKVAETIEEEKKKK